MRFTSIHMSVLLGLTGASPAPVAMPIAAPVPAPKAAMCARNVAETSLIADTIIYGVESVKCKILKCAAVIATVVCIRGALPDVDSTLACVSGKADKLCSCAGCVHKLNDWLVDYGICDGNSTAIAAP